jgi:hypothetical protein
MITFLPIRDRDLVSCTRWASSKRPSWKMLVRPMSSRSNISAQTWASRSVRPHRRVRGTMIFDSAPRHGCDRRSRLAELGLVCCAMGGVFEHSFVVDHLCCNVVDGAFKLNGHEVRPALAAERQRAFLGGWSIWGMSVLAKLILSYGGYPQTFRGNSH